MKKKTVKQSLTEQIHVIRPTHLNGGDRLFGGQLALWIDEVAGVTALRHSEMRIVTATIDNLQFKKSVKQNKVLVMIGRVTYVGRTSMEVRVDSFVEGRNGERDLINTAYLIEVGLDDDGHPAELPQLVLETEEEIREYEAAKKRRQIRQKLNEINLEF